MSQLAAFLARFQVDQTVEDAAWNGHYTGDLARAAEFHFTPLATCTTASKWLAGVAGPVVDIGAGAGKFLLAAALQYPATTWVGLERRSWLVAEGKRWIAAGKLANVVLAKADASLTNLKAFNGAYVFNPFYEHLDAGSNLDQDCLAGSQFYIDKCSALRQNLAQTPAKFRLVTYFCYGGEIPGSFEQVWEDEEQKLKGWLQTKN